MSRLLLTFIAFLFVFTTVAVAQEPFGSLEGTVRDPQGAVVQNATVTARNLATNATKTAVTNEDGQYRILQLQPGFYEVKATGPNFKQSVIESIQVQVGQTAAGDIALEVGVATETVTVAAGGEAQIERTDNTVSGVVGTRQIENLPLNGRNFLVFVKVQPSTEKVDGG